jgi:hypothetical protein
MHERRAFRGLPLAGMAVVGVVLGHWLGYLLAVPDPHLRAEILVQTGHGYWMLAIKAAVVLGFASLGTVLIRHLSGLEGGERPAEDSPAALALRLALLQLSAFVAMETIERLIVGGSVAEMFQHHIFLLGVALQLGVACIGALVLLWFGRVAQRVCEALLRPPQERARATQGFPTVRYTLQPQVLCGGAGLRGPPSH